MNTTPRKGGEKRIRQILATNSPLLGSCGHLEMDAIGWTDLTYF
jgi:hypothetical protein